MAHNYRITTRRVRCGATSEQARGLAAAVLGRLIEQGIVVAYESDCVLGGDGHAPGPNYTSTVTDADSHLHALSTNGLHGITGRTVFSSMGAEQITCPRCGRSAGLNEWRWEPPWGFGHLGFEFWNWPTLTDDFVADISRQLGHRIVCLTGSFDDVPGPARSPAT